MEKIVSRHQEHVRWVNDTFLDPNNAIQNNVDEYKIVDIDQIDKYPDAEIMMKVILFLLQRFDALEKEQATEIKNLKTQLLASEVGN